MGSYFDILNLIFLILLQRLTGFSCTIPDPCPNIQPTTKVADMCRDNYAIEEINDGNDAENNVVVRVMNQTKNCICHVSMEYQSDPTSLYIRKYNNSDSAAPEEEDCGLQVIISYTQADKVTITDSISCTNGQGLKNITIPKNGILSLRSNVINGSFTRGYCIEIMREHNPETNSALRVVCDTPGVIPSTLSQKPVTLVERNTDTYTDNSIVLGNVQPLVQMTTDYDGQRTSTMYDSVPGTNSVSMHHGNIDSDSLANENQTTWPFRQTTTVEEETEPALSETTPVFYVAVGTSSGVSLILVIIVIIVICRTTLKKDIHKGEEENASNTYNTQSDDPDYDGLKYNVLYVTSEQQVRIQADYTTVELNIDKPQFSLTEMNYNPLDDDHYSSVNNATTPSRKPPIKYPKPSIRSTKSNNMIIQDSPTTDQDKTGDDSSSTSEHKNSTDNKNVYAVVNKKKKTNENDENDRTFAVVDISIE